MYFRPIDITDTCNFTSNGIKYQFTGNLKEASIVYHEGNTRCKSSAPVSIQKSVFTGNDYLPINVSYQAVSISGNILINNNNRGGIFSSHSSIVFTES